MTVATSVICNGHASAPMVNSAGGLERGEARERVDEGDRSDQRPEAAVGPPLPRGEADERPARR